MSTEKELSKESGRKSAVDTFVMCIKLWWIRNFKIIEIERAKELGLTFAGNVYGDEINYLNCRSIWSDSKGRRYRVRQLGDYT